MVTDDATTPLDSAHSFVIHCLAGGRDPGALALARKLAESRSIDWEVVWKLVMTERVAPILYHISRDQHILPDWLLERSREKYFETGLGNDLRLRELRPLLSQLAKQGVEVILLKGLALVGQVYHNLALRPMVDIDCLVRRHDASMALSILKEAGYQAAVPAIASNAAFDFENEILLQKRDRLEWAVELHWNLFDSPFYQERIPAHILWETAEKNTLEGIEARVLSPELTLLHLCGHLALHHQARGLLWWNDIAEAIVSYGPHLNWTNLLKIAVDLDLVVPLKNILPAVSEELAAPIPVDFLAELAAAVPQPEEMKLYSKITAEIRPPARRLLTDVQGISGWRPRMRFVRINLIPSAEYMDNRYRIPHPLFRPMYYPYRWIRGLSSVVSEKFGKVRR